MFEMLSPSAMRLKAKYRQVYATPVGKDVLDDIMRVAGLAQDAPADPMQAGYFNGMRRVGLRVARFVFKDEAALMDSAMNGTAETYGDSE